MDFPPCRAPLAPTGDSAPKGCANPAAMIEILADDRERHGGVIDRLRGYEEVSLIVERLPLGDYLIDEVLLIERKTLPDLVASIKDGRLFGQAHRLAALEGIHFGRDGDGPGRIRNAPRGHSRGFDRSDPLSGYSPIAFPGSNRNGPTHALRGPPRPVGGHWYAASSRPPPAGQITDSGPGSTGIAGSRAAAGAAPVGDLRELGGSHPGRGRGPGVGARHRTGHRGDDPLGRGRSRSCLR